MEFKYRAVDGESQVHYPPSSSSDQAMQARVQAGFSGFDRRSIHVDEAIQIEKMKIREEIIAFQRELEKEQIRKEIITAETTRRRELVAEVMREMAMENHWFGQQIPLANPLGPSDPNNKSQLIILDKSDPTCSKLKSVAVTPPAVEADKFPLLGLKKKPQEEWSRALCQIRAPSKKCLKQHLQGKKHTAKEAALRTENMAKKAVGSKLTKNKEEWSCALCQVSAPNEGALHEHVHGKNHKAKEAALRAENMAKKAENMKLTKNKEWSCALCRVSAPNKGAINEHFQGKKHKAREAALRKEKMAKKAVGLNLTKNKEEWSCVLCRISAPNEGALNEHVRGKKHKAKEEALRTDNKAKKFSNSELTKNKEEWSCALCRISAPNEGALNEHFQGKKHKAKEAALRTENMVKKSSGLK